MPKMPVLSLVEPDQTPILKKMNISPEKVVAYFQPIVSADTNDIYAYEVLGRLADDNGSVTSLGRFFSDRNVSREEALSVDRLVRRYALKKYAEENISEFLFININFSWLAWHAERPKEAPTVKWAKEYGIAPEKIVIEITEEEFNSGIACMRLLTEYKHAGFRIALDDYGKNASNIKRLAALRPDIIKIDMSYIHNSEKSYHYLEYLRSIASFAQAVGIEVLFEGVETRRQLDICMDIKGRYYQGYFIAPPQPSMSGALLNRSVFAESAANAHAALHAKITERDNHRKSLDAQMESFLAANPFDDRNPDLNEYLTRLCRELPDVRRAYICDRQGLQLTCNIERHDGELAPRDYLNKNWSWRGYFSKALETLTLGGNSCLANGYRDFTTKEPVLTYFYALGDDRLLFLDL
jgi:EAL domain-containing protein (putative c-di-GMP-specific phosphodiesterase class I)